jgi:hypothetical protein
MPVPGFGLSRIWDGLHPAHWRMALAAAAFLCAIGAGGAIAYYTAAETSGVSENRQPASKWRFAENSDSWTDALRTPEFWNKSRSRSSSDESRSSRRARRSSSESTRTSRSRESRSSERRSTRDQTIREHTSRPIHEIGESDHRPTYTTPVQRGATIRYYSFVPKEISTYRTMCVRLCDGYYWPVSYSATKREFARDSEICQRSCDSPVALYAHRNLGEEVESMVDLQGRPYIALDTAFMYRAAYNEGCKCRPHPWEEAARQRHLGYQTAGKAEPAAVRKP